MNGYDNTNSIFKIEQDLDNIQLNTFGKYRMSAGLSDVHSTTGQKIGEIKSVVTDSETRTIEYVVFQFDHIFGLGEKNYFLPWDKLNIEYPSKVLFMLVLFQFNP
ncbi:PRC-barrel domain-containing protein [Cesiribacter sp. SM1]|uniref:PRC-barrel domain-containing protein n=1 Tax=Cesiribacter sp. SM1 TaxID=2861196 RepID=UPI001CD3A833|nr:PRC-barrel domain-containing protein [Cesiribacter sp. SM1]